MDELRKLHNNCKRQLISKYVPTRARVLDCGCGRGGDWWKWKAVSARVSAIDPDPQSLEEAEKRALEMGFPVVFLGAGDIRQAAFAGPFDVVCYNFSLHYIFASSEIFTASIKGIWASLEEGGILIGITPEKARAYAMADDRGYFKDKLGNEFQICQGGRALDVRLTDGPFYADGPKTEPILDAHVFIETLCKKGFELLKWEPMLTVPNGLISDLYSKFVFKKIK